MSSRGDCEPRGISRTAVSAIESQRLVPSVAAALAIAHVLECTVEELFAPPRGASPGETQFAWQPAAFPCRYWAAEVGGRTLLFPVENSGRGGLPHDGIAQGPDVRRVKAADVRQTLVVAGCDPAAGLLAAIYRRHSRQRMLLLTRTSAESLALLERGLVHVAGVHLTDAEQQGGNAQALVARLSGGRGPAQQQPLQLLHVAHWQEGLAHAPGLRLRSAAAIERGPYRWIGRPVGAGARRCQDLLRGRKPPPRHAARDHRGIVEAIRSGWADVGVCVRLASEEGQLGFLPVCEEPYDLCYHREDAGDPRLAALAGAVRSADYRRLLNELPGYRPQQLGELEDVALPKPAKAPRG